MSPGPKYLQVLRSSRRLRERKTSGLELEKVIVRDLDTVLEYELSAFTLPYHSARKSSAG